MSFLVRMDETERGRQLMDGVGEGMGGRQAALMESMHFDNMLLWGINSRGSSAGEELCDLCACACACMFNEENKTRLPLHILHPCACVAKRFFSPGGHRT